MSNSKREIAQVERTFLIASVAAAAFMVASIYVRVTSDTDPLWTEFASPIFFTILGVRAIALPSPPEQRKGSRALGSLLIACAAVILVLALLDR
jgi:peptidoglycan/LPS O-acetylase OafA/YrhL